MTASRILTPSHVYTDNGVYTVTLTVTDDDGDSGSDSIIATVDDLVPTAALVGDAVLDEGQSGSFDASSAQLLDQDAANPYVVRPSLTRQVLISQSA